MTQKDLQQIAEVIDERLENRLQPIEKELKKHSKMLKSLKKDQDTMLVMLDGEQMKQRRITTIEQTTGISS